jgi:N-methylhydantoinase B
VSIDSVTLEVVRNACTAVAEEMNATLVRTSYSPNIKDRRDCSCALFDADAKMISQAENIPVHLGAMPYSVAAAIEAFPTDELEEGDAILLNDPFHGGAHLPDLTLVTPVIVNGEVAAFAANRAHHADIGGSRAGSVAADSTEIYQEGLRIPPVRLYQGGEVNEDVMSMVLANVRTPDERRGDLRAQHAANRTADARFRELVDRYGGETFREAMDEIKRYSERRIRAELAALPDGRWAFEDVLDDDGQGTEDIRIAVAITVDGEELTVDFAGTADQVPGAVNAPFAVTASATYYAVRCVTDPDIPPNHGAYRPVTIEAPEGSVVNARPPAAVVGGNLEVSQRVTDALLGAFAEAVPERAVAAGQGTMNSITFGGQDPRTNGAFAFYETLGGGYGGRAGADGMDGVHAHMSNTLNTPVEVLETAYPLRVRRYAYRADSAGPGEFRGGLGLTREIAARADDTTFSVLADRRRHPPYGVAGGESGTTGVDEVVRDGDVQRVGAKSTHVLGSDDAVRIKTPGGAGYGDPADRDPAAIARDYRHGKVSAARIREVYGLDPDDLDAD